nr:hypothetical protein [Enterococcus faecalis]
MILDGSDKEAAYLTSKVILLLRFLDSSLTPRSKPVLNRFTTKPSSPSINPTLLVLVVFSDATPARYADSLFLNAIAATFCLPFIISSIMKNFLSGFSSTVMETLSVKR